MTTKPARRIDRTPALVSLAIAVGLVLIGYAFIRSVAGDEANGLPDGVEQVSPAPDAVQVLAQTDVVVDLAPGYEGRLMIDGVEYLTQRLGERPTAEEPTENGSQLGAPPEETVEAGSQIEIPPGVIFEPGNATLTFTPGSDVGFDRFAQGNHTVRVTFWLIEEGEEAARSFSWTFNVL